MAIISLLLLVLLAALVVALIVSMTRRSRSTALPRSAPRPRTAAPAEPRRSGLTVAAEIAGIVGTLIALIALLGR